MDDTSSLRGRTVTPKDWKALRRSALEWDVRIREGGNTPDRTTPLAMLSANFPAPINPSLYVSLGMGAISIVRRRRHHTVHTTTWEWTEEGIVPLKCLFW
jgi:hypothetical protein